MKSLQIFLLISVGVALVSSSRVPLEQGKRLIKTSEDSPGVWMTEDEIFSNLIQHGKNFMDITDFNYPAADPTKIVATSVPDQPRFQAQVRRVIDRRSGSRVEQFIRHFSSYHNRYYAAQTGRESQVWLLGEVRNSIANYPGQATVSEVDHGYLQKSIVARLEGSDPILKSEVVVFGAHLDSVNMRGSSLQAPGADDNASGSVVGLEALRAIVEEGLILKRTVEFHWYAAEEIGLRGSQAIAEDYNRRNVNVVGMLNMDVVGYYVNGINDIGIYTDYGDAQLSQFLRVLTDEYLQFGRRDLRCGYACSDHASWNRNGFPAVMAGEAVDHPQMHTVNDTLENMSLEQTDEFVKLAIGYIIEFAEPASA